MVHAMQTKWSDENICLTMDMDKCICCDGKFEVEVKETKIGKRDFIMVSLKVGGKLYNISAIKPEGGEND